MSDRSLPFIQTSGGLLLALLLIVTGCQSDTPPCGDTIPCDGKIVRPVGSDVSPQSLASTYMRYAYQGALLRSNHPLNDSVATLVKGPVSGPILTVIDTFQVGAARASSDSAYTVPVTIPHSVQIRAPTWETSAPVANKEYTLRIRNDTLMKAPHVVGWPAFQHHIRDIAPSQADSILTHVGNNLNRSPS